MGMAVTGKIAERPFLLNCKVPQMTPMTQIIESLVTDVGANFMVVLCWVRSGQPQELPLQSHFTQCITTSICISTYFIF
jgi:hypothetical protein